MRPQHGDHDDPGAAAALEQPRVPRAAPPEGVSVVREPAAAGNAAAGRSMTGDRPVPPPVVAAWMAAGGNAAASRLARGAAVQRSAPAAQGAGPLDPRIGAAIDAERGRGAPLPEDLRADLEPRLGADLSAVRVHTGSTADALNRSVTAEAFTTGADVFFSAGRYDPRSETGRELLAHELTHVVQQQAGTAATAQVSHPGDAAEVDARAVARRVAAEPAGGQAGAEDHVRRPTAAVAGPTRTVARRPSGTKEATGVVAVAQRANARAARISELQDWAITRLQAASAGLRAASEAYEEGYKGFAGTLGEADEVLAREEAASGMVQDILVGTVVGLIGPAGLATRLAIPTAAVMSRAIANTARSRAGALTTGGAGDVLKGLVDEGLEPVANWPVDVAKGEPSSPGDTAGRAGARPGGKFKQAVADLDGLVAALPNFMPLQALHHRLMDLALYAVESGSEELTEIVTWLDGETARLAGSLTNALLPPFVALVQAATATPARPPAEVERMLWMEWLPRLRPPYDELNYKVVRERLAAVGLSSVFEETVGPMTGDYAGDKITAGSANRIHNNAQEAWLAARGIPADADRPGILLSLFEAASYLESLDNARLVGRSGTFKWADSVVVDGTLYPLAKARSAGSPPRHVDPGDQVVVESVWPSWDLLRAMAARYQEDEANWQTLGALTKSLVGVTVRWNHGVGTREQPYGPDA